MFTLVGTCLGLLTVLGIPLRGAKQEGETLKVLFFKGKVGSGGFSALTGVFVSGVAQRLLNYMGKEEHP